MKLWEGFGWGKGKYRTFIYRITSESKLFLDFIPSYICRILSSLAPKFCICLLERGSNNLNNHNDHVFYRRNQQKERIKLQWLNLTPSLVRRSMYRRNVQFWLCSIYVFPFIKLNSRLESNSERIIGTVDIILAYSPFKE